MEARIKAVKDVVGNTFNDADIAFGACARGHWTLEQIERKEKIRR